MNHSVVLVNPEVLGVLFNRSDIGIGSEENVLELRLLLVHLFDCFLWTCRIGVDIGDVAVLQWAFLLDSHGDRNISS